MQRTLLINYDKIAVKNVLFFIFFEGGRKEEEGNVDALITI